MKLAGGLVACVALLLGLALIFVMGDLVPPLPHAMDYALRAALWEHRSLDLIGQILIILGGTFGVLVLTKERIET
ncbi:MAG TPA: hypothetical protein VM283_04160 [Armatimonadota bacterium]|nr:hypothetical protein [Armatimonadota bacterium]